jgi:class 3 adenylate cyclase
MKRVLAVTGGPGVPSSPSRAPRRSFRPLPLGEETIEWIGTSPISARHRLEEDVGEVSENTRNLSQYIEKSKTEVTVLFTDIVNSTQFWDQHGDTEGRLMLDLHNTLLFPVVKAFRGTIIKTIGDSIMASFKAPRDGVCAAIAMQQRLKQQRRADRSFGVHIRIGVHTGTALVESNDVFGDTVNIAARVESAAGSDEILVSQDTAKKLPEGRAAYKLVRKRNISPKGKRRRLAVWSADWKACQDLTDGIRRQSIVPPNPRQSVELVLFFVASVAAVYLLYTEVLRFLLADLQLFALYLVNPHPVIQVVLITVPISIAVLAVRKILQRKKMPLKLFKLIKGGFGFGVLFFPMLWAFQMMDLDLGRYWNGVLHKTTHSFAEVITDGVDIHRRPTGKAPAVARADKGDLYILQTTVTRSKQKWARVLARQGPNHQGYILYRRPPKIGVPAEQLIEKRRFTFRYYHLYALGLGLLGFLWGVTSFRLRPL